MKHFWSIRIFLYLILCALLLNPTRVGAQSEEVTSTLNPRQESKYIVINLSGGVHASSYPVSYLSYAPANGWTDEYKSNKLVLRRIKADTFMMGSPDDELGRNENEDLHEVTLTEPFYIGVFQITQKQWELVMGYNPSSFKGNLRPVERVSYNQFRGASKGAQWPKHREVDATSFFGKLRAKTALDFDLPTEAQWEYACRAGTTTALNSGKDLTRIVSCPNMSEVGRYWDNQHDGRGGYLFGHTEVGSYRPNAWGLYDMHGNVLEWCTDWYVKSLGTEPVTDPVGPTSGTERAVCGGGGPYFVQDCRSANRSKQVPSFSVFYIGARAVIRIGLWELDAY